MTREVRPLARALALRPEPLPGLHRAWRGDGRMAAVIGIGPESAARGTERLLDAFDVEHVLVVGVAGAVDPALGVGDVLQPDRVVDRASGTVYRPHRPGGRGTLVTSNAIGGALAGGTPADQAAADATLAALASSELPAGTSAVDMETAAVARACEARHVAWSVVRTISDVPGTLDDGILELVRPDGALDPAAVARRLARDPAAALRLARIGRDTQRAVRVLTRTLLAEL